MTNTIKFIINGEVPRGHTVMLSNFVCDYYPLKLEPFRAIITVEGDIL